MHISEYDLNVAEFMNFKKVNFAPCIYVQTTQNTQLNTNNKIICQLGNVCLKHTHAIGFI